MLQEMGGAQATTQQMEEKTEKMLQEMGRAQSTTQQMEEKVEKMEKMLQEMRRSQATINRMEWYTPRNTLLLCMCMREGVKRRTCE